MELSVFPVFEDQELTEALQNAMKKTRSCSATHPLKRYPGGNLESFWGANLSNLDNSPFPVGNARYAGPWA